MQSKRLDTGRETTYLLVFDEGDEFNEEILRFARQQDITAASFTAIGAFQDARLGWFDMEQREYFENQVKEQVEVLSLVGNIAEHRGEPKVHAHVVLGKKNAAAVGGHLLAAHVRPTLEVMLTESPLHLHRQFDERTGLPLIRPEVEGLPHRRGRPADAGVEQEESRDDRSDSQQAGSSESRSEEPERSGVGLGMGYAVDKPQDSTDWKQCPDCQVWVHGRQRTSCPNCGYVFGQKQPG